MLRRSLRIIAMLALFLTGAILFGLARPSAHSAAAAPVSQQTPTPETGPASPTHTPLPDLSISNEYCLSCHGQPGQTMKLANGEDADLYVPNEIYQNSIHGQLGYACVQCHRTVGEYPHPPFTATDQRDVTLQLYQACKYCHAYQYELAQDSVHATAQANGNRQAAVCSDCHTAHEVRRLNDPETHTLLPDARMWIPQRCALCHNAIYQKYIKSVHGSALTEGNPDVPTCIDCHGVHNIPDPTTNAFRLKSPQLCAKCHTDPVKMAKYGLTTNVLSSYVADFHGTTTEVFAKESPDAQVNTPVCFDCHGVHDISRVDDPQTGLEMKNNLLARCRECHPDATADFPTAWMSHYTPSPDVYPLVYYVNLFYKFFIPFTLGGMAVLVAMDAGRTLLNRARRKAIPKRVSEPLPAEIKPETTAEPSVEEGTQAGQFQAAETQMEAAGEQDQVPEVSAKTEAEEPQGAEPPAPAAPPETDQPGPEVKHG
jgi:predicted CXXCH cytochrome family protein